MRRNIFGRGFEVAWKSAIFFTFCIVSFFRECQNLIEKQNFLFFTLNRDYINHDNINDENDNGKN